MSATKVLKICTHSGSFHADESLAVYMLKTLKQFKNATLTRSRNPADWEEADIVVDVSGKYDGVKHFDHHQREFNTTFNDQYKTKLSSAGLVYKHFGKDIISENLDLDPVSNSKEIEFLYDRVYRDYIEAIDADDNGINKYANHDDLKPLFRDRNFQISSIVSNLNPPWDSDATDADFDAQFAKASEIMGVAFMNFLTYMGKSFLPAKQYVEKAFADRFNADPSGKIVVLDRFVPWKEHLFNIEKENNAVGEILYVLFKDSSNTWRIAAVPLSSSSFDSRKKLPEAWRGLRDEELSTFTGVPGCVFIHAAGFIGGAKTKEAVLELAKQSL
ncbi:hypothetical protein CANARDRAFT_175097 [[Candida] arabinofermentans NRRL YB-2248]|uniref:Metal-dependent protein hydrolase n=1 Tax=[Candida] arabinofermentans NRRL YB-2248 TaxID=983967 RepID=A0A1E4T334_9ASCO|nr:hypothetical protein CANARDRAFT_175097 [[Candida] arabinofermentans NRRL YB-2248]